MYDEETGLYYLRSRYYCSAMSRFTNADIVFSSGNLFSYCDNNPINYADNYGFDKDSLHGFDASGTKFWYYAIHNNHGKYISGEGFMYHIHLLNSKTGIEYSINADKTIHDPKKSQYPDKQAMKVLKKDKKIKQKWPPKNGPGDGGVGYEHYWNDSGESVNSDNTASSQFSASLSYVAVSQLEFGFASTTTISPSNYTSTSFSTSLGTSLTSAYWQAEAAVASFFGYLDEKITEICIDDMGVPVF